VIGTEDERGQLFQAYCDVLDVLEPEVFVFENVYGLPGANGGEPWREIVAAFQKRGYKLIAEVVDAADYGVPQHRERLIMVGTKTDGFTFPQPTHGPDSRSGKPLVSVETAIADLQNPDEPYHDNLGGMYGHLLPLVPEGLNYSYFTAEMNHPAPVFAWRSKFHDLLYKVDRQAPCRTLKAQPGKFTGPFHWKNRHFTTAELKRLQTFPDSYVLTGTKGAVMEQIGNSVPPKLAEVIAVSVREQLFERKRELTFAVRPEGFKSTFRQRQRAKTVQFHAMAKANNVSQTVTSAPKKPKCSNLFLVPENIFTRRVVRRRTGLPNHALEVRVADASGHIEIDVARLDGRSLPQSIIEIVGLRKYLPDFDSLTLVARIESMEEIFHVWAVVEEALVTRSRFFTLIDIYGHYANRGDTVRISADWNLPIAPILRRMLNYVSKTDNCGQIVPVAQLVKAINSTEKQAIGLVEDLRAIRFDTRTSATHPIIKPGMILCTYPFPLLSPRALVESRARIVRDEQERQSLMVKTG